MSNQSKRPPLKDLIEGIVESAGGWLNVITRLAPAFSRAVQNHGHGVDCPFPERHRNGGGIGDFRFVNSDKYPEGFSICSCEQRGWAPVDLLIAAGVGRTYVDVCKEIKRAYAADQKDYKPKALLAPKRVRPRTTAADNVRRSEALQKIVKDLLPLGHPDARIGRVYFNRRGIRLNKAIGDVMFHPALPYNCTRRENGRTVKEEIGVFPAIVSLFRNGQGRLMNLHRIYLTQDGRKLDHKDVVKVKKVCQGLENWSKTPIAVATVAGCRTLHICEGVEKAWAIHLATGESAQAGSSCTSLPGMYVDRAAYDDVVLWSDHDPYNEVREKYGDGQTYMFKLFVQLMTAGFRVCLMIPDTNPTLEAKGPDWEDVVVTERVLEMPMAQRFEFLRSRALEGGVFTPTGHAKQHPQGAVVPFDRAA